MRYLAAGIVVAGLSFGLATEAKAQFSMTIGSPYYGSGFGVGTGYYGGLNPGYGSIGGSNYYGGYLGGPGSFTYSSGYNGVGGVGYYGNGIGNTYGGYGYSYGYGVRPGFHPFRGGRRFYR